MEFAKPVKLADDITFVKNVFTDSNGVQHPFYQVQIVVDGDICTFKPNSQNDKALCRILDRILSE